jgi:predicted RND superfamily exporter protein
MKKHLNIFVFVSLSILYLALSPNFKFSTNFLELFFSQKSITLLDVISKLGLSNNIMVAKKGFEDSSVDELYEIADELKKLPQISKITITLTPSKQLKEYYKKNYYLLAEFNSTKPTKDEIYNKLKSTYDSLQDSFIYIPLDTNDPLHLFSMQVFEHNKYIKVKDFGYALKASTNIDTSSAKEAKKLYNQIQTILSKHKDVISYAPFYFLVENSTYIQKDTQKIITIATILLFILYFFMLNYKILIHTVFAILSSVMGAIIVLELYFHSINVMVLAFGVSITTISIDYMFHYYFHGEFEKKGIIKQKSVLFGFITTFGVFVIFSFIDIKLFYQLAFFSAVSLFIAFCIFSLTFGYLDIPKPQFLQKSQVQKTFNPLYVILLSSFLLLYSFLNLEFDNNLKNLDYKNEKLQKLSKLFNQSLLQSSYQSIILSAKTKEKLLQNYEKLQKTYPNMLGIGRVVPSQKRCKKRLEELARYGFSDIKKAINTQAKKVGFNDAFKNSYANIDKMECKNISLLDDMGFKLIKVQDRYYTMVLMAKDYKLRYSDDMQPLDVAKTLLQDMQKTKDSVVKFIYISVAFIILMLFMLSGSDILYPLSFVLFPLSVVLFFISIFGTINIMHLFALIILISISIDYGVYMHNTQSVIETKMAIKYALLSTLAGFGVLVLSDTVALHSIGFVISVGIGAIFILIYGRKI